MMEGVGSEALEAPEAPEVVVYPDPVLSNDEVCRDPNVFMDILRRFHCAIGTRFMIPVIGGKDLNLHHLYVQVTQRGGLERVILERRWREVITEFNFPPTTTSASFALRKYYLSLLHHFEQAYYFRAQGPLVAPSAAIQTKAYTTSVSDSAVTALGRRKRFQLGVESQADHPSFVINANGCTSADTIPKRHPYFESATGAQHLPSAVHVNGFISSNSAAQPHTLVESTTGLATLYLSLVGQNFPPAAGGNGQAFYYVPSIIPTTAAPLAAAPIGSNFPPCVASNGQAFCYATPMVPIAAAPPAACIQPIPSAVHADGFPSSGSATLPHQPTEGSGSATLSHQPTEVSQNFPLSVDSNGPASTIVVPLASATAAPPAPAPAGIQPIPSAVHANGFPSSGSATLSHQPTEVAQNFPLSVGSNGPASTIVVPPTSATAAPPAPAPTGIQPIPSAIHVNGFPLSGSATLSHQPTEVAQNLPLSVGSNGPASTIVVSSDSATAVPPAPAPTGPYNFTVTGRIDGKFEHGYFVTVKTNSQVLRGVLFHASDQAPATAHPPPEAPSNIAVSYAAAIPTVRLLCRRRRRRLRRYRDPEHPKPNRSAYNFFFADKHSKLRVMFPHREREFSKMIGESWNRLTEEDREVYHAFGRRDKERYRREMQEYRERLKLAQSSNSSPVEFVRLEPANLQIDAAAIRVA